MQAVDLLDVVLLLIKVCGEGRISIGVPRRNALHDIAMADTVAAAKLIRLNVTTACSVSKQQI